MIDEKFLKEVGLSQEQKSLILEAIQKERLYHSILIEEGITPKIALKIIEATQLSEVNDTNEDLLRLKVRETWKDFMRKEEESNEGRSLYRL